MPPPLPSPSPARVSLSGHRRFARKKGFRPSPRVTAARRLVHGRGQMDAGCKSATWVCTVVRASAIVCVRDCVNARCRLENDGEKDWSVRSADRHYRRNEDGEARGMTSDWEMQKHESARRYVQNSRVISLFRDFSRLRKSKRERQVPYSRPCVRVARH